MLRSFLLRVPSLVLIVVAAGAFSVACGSVDDSSTNGPQPVDHPECTVAPCTNVHPTTGPDAKTASVQGSYQLVFQNVDRTDGNTSSPGLPLPQKRASIDVLARLDITASATAKNGFEVALTSRWGSRAVLVVDSITDLAVNVSGKAEFGVTGESNEWTKLTLARSKDGSLSGKFTASGQLTVSGGDVLDTYAVTGDGTIGKDTTAPEMRIADPSRSRGGVRLPWDEVYVQLAEPLAESTLYPALTSALPELGWPAVGAVKPTDLVTSYSGKATSFTLGGATRTIAAPSGVVDPSKNVLVPFQASLTFRDVGAPLARHDFTAASGTTWGAIDRVADARCEDGGCLVLAPSSQNSCAAAQGIAGRLSLASPITKVHARIRVLANNPNTSASAPVVYDPIRLEVASPDGTIAYASSPAVSGFTLTNEDADLPWSSGWMTIDATVTGGKTDAGFHLIRPVCDSGGGLPFPDANVSVIVDSVWAE